MLVIIYLLRVNHLLVYHINIAIDVILKLVTLLNENHP